MNQNQNQNQNSNLCYLTDQALLAETRLLVEKEREVLTEVLHHLKEIERRRLFSDLKYSSLFDYAVHELKYSEAQAVRRISAMRLLRDLPQIEIQITDGSLSLTNLNLAQSLFLKAKQKGQAYGLTQKEEVLKTLENKSTREAQKIVFEISPELKSENQKRLSHQVGFGVNLDLGLDALQDLELKKKLTQIKGLFAHTHPKLELAELLHLLCDRMLDQKLPSAPKVKSMPKASVKPLSRAEIYRMVWLRDQARCTKCHSIYNLEVDHINPRGMGGEESFENLRLLCRSCNQRAAIQFYGQGKMDVYLNCAAGAS